MEPTISFDLSSQISQTLDITPKKMKTTNSKSFLYFGRFYRKIINSRPWLLINETIVRDIIG